jgi:hypothetical protein
MSLVMLYICSKKEGSVVNLDLEDAISWSFHFMIYMPLVPRAVEVDENCFGMQWEGGICLGEMGAPPSLGCRALKLDSWRGGGGGGVQKWKLLRLPSSHDVLPRPSVG